MKLHELANYSPITIQCHDNPDADAIASGYGLYCYFKGLEKDVRLIYSGRNTISKSNLKMMVEKFEIPISYVEVPTDGNIRMEGLLITVDCQYGAGNVTKIDADNVAIIDHHQVEIDDVEMSLIIPGLGSCSTIVWKMLSDEGFEINEQNGIGTALYYGLFTDTNQFAELSNPLDKDLQESVEYDKSLINQLRNSNLSLAELEIAGIAMLRYSFNEEYEFAVIKSHPCDPNILGLISDFLLQVDRIKTCVVYNESGDGWKISVRSCIKEVNASELSAYLTKDIGSGGGHYEKAGGFVSKKLYMKKFKTLHIEGYFNNRMTEYFDSFDLIYANDYVADTSKMKKYVKNKLPIGYVNSWEILPIGTPITIRTLEGDMDLTVEEDLVILIGIKGEVYPNILDKFKRSYILEDKKYICDKDINYLPTIKVRSTGKNMNLTDFARTCIPSGNVNVYAVKLTRGVKVFTAWDKEKYMLGMPGDYLTVRSDDMHDVYIVEQAIFRKTYTQTSD